jgi:hypothetical protein
MSNSSHTPFVKDALAILAGHTGNYPCVGADGRPSTLRKEWKAAQLQLWERTEGKAITGIDTMTHWLSYTGA